MRGLNLEENKSQETRDWACGCHSCQRGARRTGSDSSQHAGLKVPYELITDLPALPCSQRQQQLDFPGPGVENRHFALPPPPSRLLPGPLHASGQDISRPWLSQAPAAPLQHSWTPLARKHEGKG